MRFSLCCKWKKGLVHYYSPKKSSHLQNSVAGNKPVCSGTIGLNFCNINTLQKHEKHLNCYDEFAEYFPCKNVFLRPCFLSGFPRIITKVFSDFLCLRDILISFSGWRTPRAEKIVHCMPCTCSFQIAASHWSIKRPVHQTIKMWQLLKILVRNKAIFLWR